MHDEWSQIKLLYWKAFEVILFLTTNFNCCSSGSNWIAKTSIAKLFVIFRNMNYYANQHQCFSWKSAFSLTWPASMQIYWNKRKSQEFNSHRICLEHQYGRRDVMWKRSITLSQLCDEWLKKPRVFLSNLHMNDSSLV